MLLFKLAVRNLWRNTRRTLLTSGGIALGLMFVLVVVNFQYGSHQLMLRTAIKSMAGHVVVQADGYQAEKEARSVLTDSGQVAESLTRTFPEGTVLRRAFLDGAIMSPSNTRMVALMGVEPEAEAFSTCVIARPVAPRCRNTGRPGAMPRSAVPTNADSTAVHGTAASASASRMAARPSATYGVSESR